MYFEIVGELSEIEVIAKGRGIQVWRRLQKKYGPGQWRKLKGTAIVRLISGNLRRAEIHWYEAHGVGKRGFKMKRLLD